MFGQENLKYSQANDHYKVIIKLICLRKRPQPVPPVPQIRRLNVWFAKKDLKASIISKSTFNYCTLCEHFSVDGAHMQVSLQLNWNVTKMHTIPMIWNTKVLIKPSIVLSAMFALVPVQDWLIIKTSIINSWLNSRTALQQQWFPKLFHKFHLIWNCFKYVPT